MSAVEDARCLVSLIEVLLGLLGFILGAGEVQAPHPLTYITLPNVTTPQTFGVEGRNRFFF